MDLMAYWRWDIYVRDLDEGAGFHFNSRQRRLHTGVSVGDRLWLVTGRPTSGGIRYLVIGCLFISGKAENPPDYKYGQHRIWADYHKSRYFTSEGPDAGQILRSLRFATGRPITGGNIGQALQTMRSVTHGDTLILDAFTRDIPIEPRAYQLVDEYALEIAFESGEEQVRELVSNYHVGVSAGKRTKLLLSYQRNRGLVQELNALYNGRCQLCGFDPELVYNVRACNAHHLVYLAHGGEDSLSNMMLLSRTTTT